MHVQYKVNPLFVIFMEFKESPNTWPRYLSGAALWQLQNLQAWRVTWLSVSWGTEGTIKSGVHFAANGWFGLAPHPSECRRWFESCLLRGSQPRVYCRALRVNCHAPDRPLRTGRLRAHKQTTKLSSSLGLSPSNSILPHSITEQLQKTKGYGSKDDLTRIFGVISAESGTGIFQLNIELRLQFSVIRDVKLLEGCCWSQTQSWTAWCATVCTAKIPRTCSWKI